MDGDLTKSELAALVGADGPGWDDAGTVELEIKTL